MGGIDEDPHLEREHTSTSNSPGASSSRQRQGTGDDRLDADWNAWTAAGNGPTSSSPSTLTSTPRPRAPERGQISRAGSWYDPLSQNAGGAGDEGERRTATSHPLDESLRAGTCTGNDGFERPQRLATSSTVLEDQHRHHEHPLSESDDEPDNGDGDEPHSGSTSSDEFYEDGVADYLDVVDPEISTLGVLSSVGHSIFVPNVPGLGFGSRTTTTDLARAPSVKRESTAKRTISRRGSVASSAGHGAAGQGDEGQTNRPTLGARLSSVLSLPTRAAKGGLSSTLPTSLPTTTTTTASVLTSKPEKPSSASASASASLGQGLTEGELGVGVGEGAESSDSHVAKWASMDELERNELDEHVRLLLTKKEKFKRGMRGFGKFVRTRECGASFLGVWGFRKGFGGFGTGVGVRGEV